jgi:hypothetical protein
LNVTNNRGIINLNSLRSRLIRIEIADFVGNTTVQYITLKKSAKNISKTLKDSPHKWLKHGVADSFDINGVVMCFDHDCLAYDTPFTLHSSQLDGTTYFDICDAGYALLGKVKIHFPLSYAQSNAVLVKKLGNKYFIPKFAIDDHHYTVFISEFGRYHFYLDNIHPTITPVSFSPNPQYEKENFKFKLSDDVKSTTDDLELKYYVYIDDSFKPCEYKAVTEILYVPILKDGLMHRIRIEANDHAGNKSTWIGQYQG